MAGERVNISQPARADVQGNWLGDAGNWVGGQVGSAANWLGDRVGDALDIREDEARLDAEEELAAFMGKKYKLKNQYQAYLEQFGGE